MPTYENTGRRVFIVYDYDKTKYVNPGDTGVAIYRYINLEKYPELVKVSDDPATWNNVIAQNADSSTGESDPKTITLETDADVLEIHNTDDVAVCTLYFGDATNDPGYIIAPRSNRKIRRVKGRAEQIVMTYSAAVSENIVFVSQLRADLENVE